MTATLSQRYTPPTAPRYYKPRDTPSGTAVCCRCREASDARDFAFKSNYVANCGSCYGKGMRPKFSLEERRICFLCILAERAPGYASKYGLSFEALVRLWARDGFGCAICQEDISSVGPLELDHNHTFGNPRGFICRRCNAALGNFLDDPVRMLRAARYLQIRLPARAVIWK